jgi:ribosomal-protein-alanine N-acetyltransferase
MMEGSKAVFNYYHQTASPLQLSPHYSHLATESHRSMNHQLTIREATVSDIDNIVGYWTGAPLEYLQNMGVDTTDLSRFDNMPAGIQAEFAVDYPEKKTFHLIAELDGKPIGHTYVNDVTFGQEAFVHLHLWRDTPKRQGLGQRMVAASIPLFFEKLAIQTLYCEPSAANPGPNRTMLKLGFDFVKTHVTIPAGWNFELEVTRWALGRKKYLELYGLG